MRSLLSTIGSRGDVQPLVALALHLKALGTDVRLCIPPDFCEWVRGLGLSAMPIGPEVRTAVPPGRSPSPSPEQRRQAIEGTVTTQFATITEAAQGCDVIVAATALQIAARSVAERMGIRYVFAAYCPIVLPSVHHAPPPLPTLADNTVPMATDTRELWARDAARFNDVWRPALNAHRAALGLPAVDDVRSYMFTDAPWLAADETVAPWPTVDDDHVFQAGAWIAPDERPLPPEVESFLDAGEPPVYFGFGSTRTLHDAGELVVDAARALGRRAIVSGGWGDMSVAGEARDALAIGDVNVRSLFTRVAAVVHHGGAGTTTVTALAGAPQVVIPQMYDQHYWARRVHELGIGVAHAPGRPTRESLTSALDSALRPDVRPRAQSLMRSMRLDGAQRAAARLIAGE